MTLLVCICTFAQRLPGAMQLGLGWPFVGPEVSRVDHGLKAQGHALAVAVHIFSCTWSLTIRLLSELV